MATVELAAALPVLMVLMLVAIFAVHAADERVRCADAAREVARAAARGDPAAVALGESAVSGARISVTIADGLVTATVTVTLRPVGTGIADVTVTERATAAVEPR